MRGAHGEEQTSGRDGTLGREPVGWHRMRNGEIRPTQPPPVPPPTARRAVRDAARPGPGPAQARLRPSPARPRSLVPSPTPTPQFAIAPLPSLPHHPPRSLPPPPEPLAIGQTRDAVAAAGLPSDVEEINVRVRPRGRESAPSAGFCARPEPCVTHEQPAGAAGAAATRMRAGRSSDRSFPAAMPMPVPPPPPHPRATTTSPHMPLWSPLLHSPPPAPPPCPTAAARVAATGTVAQSLRRAIGRTRVNPDAEVGLSTTSAAQRAREPSARRGPGPSDPRTRRVGGGGEGEGTLRAGRAGGRGPRGDGRRPRAAGRKAARTRASPARPDPRTTPSGRRRRKRGGGEAGGDTPWPVRHRRADRRGGERRERADPGAAGAPDATQTRPKMLSGRIGGRARGRGGATPPDPPLARRGAAPG